ncbi:hypothetical protein BDR22DRAFT_890216 [Usnea florida]
MAEHVRTAERIAHRIVRQTKNAMAWTGAVQAFFSALDLLWTLWSAWREGREDERRRERQDREDERRRKKADREERKRDAAIEQLKTEMKTVREDLESKLGERIEKDYKVKILVLQGEVTRLERENTRLRSQLGSSPGRAPGGLGDSSAATAAGG